MSVVIAAKDELLARDDARMAVSYTALAMDLKAYALERCALIGRVTNAAEQTEAVEAQKALRGIIKQTEDNRVEMKKPVLDYGRRIDDAAKLFVEELRMEEIRIATLVGNFQTAELARARAAEAAERSRLTALEKERQLALAASATHEQRDEVNTKFDQEATVAVVAPVIPTKVEGQTVREDWEIEVTDIHALYRSHPRFVKLTPLMMEIRTALDAGVTPPGVRAKRVVKSGVRVGNRAIDVQDHNSRVQRENRIPIA